MTNNHGLTHVIIAVVATLIGVFIEILGVQYINWWMFLLGIVFVAFGSWLGFLINPPANQQPVSDRQKEK